MENETQEIVAFVGKKKLTQQWLFSEFNSQSEKRQYLPFLTVVENQKGVLDVDTVKGCSSGMNAYPKTGCYGECYANKTANRYGIDFETSVSRQLNSDNYGEVFFAVKDHYATWYRIGTAGDPRFCAVALELRVRPRF